MIIGRRALLRFGAGALATPWLFPSRTEAVTTTPLDGQRLAFLRSLDRITDVPFSGPGNGATVLTFFATWCPPCRPEFEALNRIRKRYPAESVAIIAINVFESFGGLSTAGSRRRFYGVTDPLFPVLDGNAEAAQVFGGITRIPTLMIFDSSGAATFTFVHEDGSSHQYVGFDEIEARIAPLLQ